MSNVYVMIMAVPAVARDKRIYGSGTAFTSVFSQPSIPAPAVSPTDVIEFTAISNPSLLTYNTLYAPTHGQWPRITLITIDADNNRIERIEKPTYIMTDKDGTIDDLIDSIVYDLAQPETGYMILQ